MFVNMELVRAGKNNLWAQAGAYYVRIQAMVNGFGIPLGVEIDKNDTSETEYVIAVDGVLPVGTCRLHITDDRTAKIERVCVLEEYRKKGIGRLVIEEAEKWLKEKGVRKVIITSRDEAVGFYEKLGYTVDWSRQQTGGVFTIVYTEKEL